ncbi:MAG TPA: sugar kinase [Casimicrobiaceae bacterium]|nr:sugar kinase [Casimicrobiaceae bacterium]
MSAARKADSVGIVSLGEPMIEFNQARRDDSSHWMQGFGGDTSNMAIAASRLGNGFGINSGYITRIGDDAFGRMLRELWAHEGVSQAGVVVDASAPTGVYFVSHGPSGHEFSYLRAGSAASRMTADTLPLDVIRSTRVLHVSGISQAISSGACDACFAAFDAARRAGASVSYDPNLRLKLWPLARARAIIRESVACADWVMPSHDDAKALFDVTDENVLVDTLHRLGAGIVVLKCGAQGCVVSDGRRRERIAGHSVATVDATGAGDCFDGAFAVRMLAGDDVIVAARYANAAAALATTGFGAVAPLPSDAAVRALLRQQQVLA